MEKIENTNTSFYYPPGGILIWLIVFVELITFSAITIVFLMERSNAIDDFTNAQHLLNKNFGLINTLILLTSSLFMALSIQALKEGKKKWSLRFLTFTLLFGIAFLFLKGIEYEEKLQLGLGLSASTFFQYYWLLTGFHFVHVIIGVLLITYMLIKTKSGFYHRDHFEDVESTGIFWHMCDLIWVFLFPIIYLIH